LQDRGNKKELGRSEQGKRSQKINLNRKGKRKSEDRRR
jgi:hypothetical protein